MPKETEPKEILIAQAAAKAVNERRQAEAAADEADLNSKKQAAATLATLNTVSAAPASDLQNQVLATLLQSLQHDLSKKQAKEAEEEENLRRLMLARADGIRHEKANREAAQNYCDHRKEDGRTRIVGQKLSNNHLSLMCGYCYKEFNEDSVPPSLRPSGDFIGG